MRKFISALVFGAILLPGNGFTLGMGEIEVNSALNQQLKAKIKLLSSVPEDAETLIVKLASREEFVRAGLDRPYDLSSLKFKAVVEGGHVYIEVSSPKPIREPFLNFLIEVDWPKGHMLREYTILLDPPVFMGSTGSPISRPKAEESRPAAQSASTVAAVPAESFKEAVIPGGFRPTSESAVSESRPSGASAAPVTAAAVPEEQSSETNQSQTFIPVPAPARQQQTSTSYASPSGDYRVQQGDTAWSLADSMRPDQSVSIQQMLLAMLRTNPDVFIEGNVNGLKKGYILRVPDRSEITAITAVEAKALVMEQNALWREYQQSQSVDQPASAPIIEDEDAPVSSSGIPSSSDSRLSIVSAGRGEGASSETKDPTEMTAEELREQLALAREQLETERVENEGLEGNVGALEERIGKMQSLLQIEDDSLAEMQATAQGEADLGTEAADNEEISEEDAALSALEDLTGDIDAFEEDGNVEETATEAVVEGDELFIDDEAMAEAGIAAAMEEIAAESTPAVSAPREPPGLVASLLGNPLVTGGVALLVLVLLTVGYILFKRRRDSAGAEAEKTLATDLEYGLGDEVVEKLDDSLDDFAIDEEVEDSMSGAEAKTEKESFDSEATMVLPSAEDTVVTAAANVSAEEEEERDDVIAEADVYLAYGIYQQAEELLKTAISNNPDKDSYKVKLAETYLAGKNAKSLTELGKEMHSKLAGKDSPAWKKIAAMGKELCPDEEIFKKAGMVADLDLDDIMSKSPEPMDFDLGSEDAADLDLDFGDDIASDISVDETIALPNKDETASADDELEFDMGETEAVEEAPSEEDYSLDFEASELDIKTEEKETPNEIVEEEDAVEIDSSELDFDVDLSDEAESSVGAEEGEVDLSDLGDVDEINTKLDLAKAYMDMGDNEGARDILDEVVVGGNAEQKKQAQELLTQVG